MFSLRREQDRETSARSESVTERGLRTEGSSNAHDPLTTVDSPQGIRLVIVVLSNDAATRSPRTRVRQSVDHHGVVRASIHEGPGVDDGDGARAFSLGRERAVRHVRERSIDRRAHSRRSAARLRLTIDPTMPPADAGVASMDSGLVEDAGAPAEDARAVTDARRVEASSGGGAVDGGCGCRTTRTERPRWTAIALGIAGVSVLARRRDRRLHRS